MVFATRGYPEFSLPRFHGACHGAANLNAPWRAEILGAPETLQEATAGEPGVRELCRLNAVRAEASYRLFRIDWLEGGGMRTLLDEAAALARQLHG